MTKQELISFINRYKDKIGITHIAIDEKFLGQYTLGYYYDNENKKYKVYKVDERQNMWIIDEFDNEFEAIDKLYHRIIFTFNLYKYIANIKTNVIDGVSVENNNLIIILLDENNWEFSSEFDHLNKLQKKLNTYLSFIETKQYIKEYGGNFTKIIIQAGFKYRPTKNGIDFLNKAKKIIESEGIVFDIVLPN